MAKAVQSVFLFGRRDRLGSPESPRTTAAPGDIVAGRFTIDCGARSLAMLNAGSRRLPQGAYEQHKRIRDRETLFRDLVSEISTMLSGERNAPAAGKV
jgi:hypothetical protein